MSLIIEQIAEAALALPGKARALLADRLVENLDPLKDGYIQQLLVAEVRTRRDNVSFSIEESKVADIIGANEAGKSTTENRYLTPFDLSYAL